MAKAKEESVKIVNTISNTSVNLIQITEDKLKNILSAHIARIRKSSDYVGSIGLFLSCSARFLLLISATLSEFQRIR